MSTKHLTRRGFLKGMGGLATVTALGVAIPSPVVASDEGAGKQRLRFGIQTPPQHTGYKQILEVWEEADRLAYDTAFVFDHFAPIFSDPNGPCFEGWTLLSALAARTRRIRVGVLVTGNTYRHPSLLAKMAATVDHVSDGRLILGMGAGWFEFEHQAYGIPFYTTGERARRLREAVRIVKALFTEQKASLAGKYYQLKDAPFEPKPVQRPHPPILIGGMGPKVIQPLAARHANIWHFYLPEGDSAKTKQICMDFDALCRKLGRNPAEVEKAVSLTSTDVAPLATADIRHRIQGLADAGVQHFILSLRAPYDRELLRRFATEVVPPLREASQKTA